MKILRLRSVVDRCGLARSTIYKYIALGKFPKPVSLSGRCVGWLESEVDDWIRSQLQRTT